VCWTAFRAWLFHVLFVMQLLTHALRQLTTAYYQAPAAGRGFMQRRCPSVCPFVCLSVCCLKLGPVTGACPAYRPPRVSHVRENFPLVQVMLEAPVSYIVSSPVKPPPPEIYACGGGLLVASINARCTLVNFQLHCKWKVFTKLFLSSITNQNV